MEPQPPAPNFEQRVVNPETTIPSRALALATITSYPNWYPGDVREEEDLHMLTDKVRGDIGLSTLKKAKEKGYQIVVVDGGSSDTFKAALAAIGIVPQTQLETGYSAGRQQSYMKASTLDGVKVILSTEAEKLSVIDDCLTDEVMQPIVKREADIVLFKRDEKGWSTYPEEQADYEKKANKLWNAIMKKHGLLPESAEDLDVWFGPRLIRNDPKIVNLFLERYELKLNNKLGEIVHPFKWANALFLPITNALHRRLRVTSVTVPYRHPIKMKQMEEGNSTFRRLRDIQYKSIMVPVMHLIRMLENENNPKGKLTKI